MLKKLLKHEFRATGRIMLPLFGIFLIISLFFAVAVRFWANTDIVLINVLMGLMICLFICGFIAMFTVLMVLMVTRFRNNLLRDEGYVMFTLPVNVHQLVWAKALTAVIWFFATLLVCLLSGLLFALVHSLGTDAISELLRQIRALWAQFDAYYAVNILMFSLEILLATFLGYLCFCLTCYASLSIGYGFDRNKLLYSVLIYVAISIAMQTLGTIIAVPFSMNYFFVDMENIQEIFSAYHTLMALSNGLLAISSVACYFATTHCLKNRLNLE